MSGQRLSYSVGFPLSHNTSDLLELIPAGVWTPAYDAHDEIRDGAWVGELTGLLDMSGWPEGMRVIVRKERHTRGRNCGSPASTDLALNGHQARLWEPKRLRLRLFTLPASIARTGRQVRLHLATKAPGSTSSTKASAGYEPWPSPVDVHPPVPTTTARPPATWNRRPPETTLGPPSHPNDKTNSSRRPAAATTLNTRGVKDRG